jgi:hypothetical protein
LASSKRLLIRLRRAGLTASITGGGHIRIETPKGPVYAPTTGSDWRGIRNLSAVLRAHGVHVDWRTLV